jgi:hypothetical protein
VIVERARDNQRQRVYDAEQAAWAKMMPEGKRSYHQTISNDDLTAFVNGILDKRPVRSRWGARVLRVEFTHDGARAHGQHSVRFGKNMRNELIVCHEVAHTLTDGSNEAWHGPEFIGVYLFLVKMVMGPEWAKALSDEFRERRVRRSNKGIPPVRANVPLSRKDRDAVHRRAARAEALTKINHWVRLGVVRKADLKRLAEGKVAA